MIRGIWLVVFALVGATAASPSVACSLYTGVELFRPTTERWSPAPGPKQLDSSAEGDHWERVPAPTVELKRVERASTSPGASCDDAGMIELKIALPKSSSYKIEDFGVYFRHLSGELPDLIFEDVPLVGPISGDEMTFLLVWLDGHPSRQIPLDISAEAFLVTNGLNIGPSTQFRIVSPVGTDAR